MYAYMWVSTCYACMKALLTKCSLQGEIINAKLQYISTKLLKLRHEMALLAKEPQHRNMPWGMRMNIGADGSISTLHAAGHPSRSSFGTR
jgi:hypothetical protein